MTKLSQMDFPKNHPMDYCEKCKSWVPYLPKHLIKHPECKKKKGEKSE